MAELRNVVFNNYRLRIPGRTECEVVTFVCETIPEDGVSIPVKRGVEDDEDRVAGAGQEKGEET